ncbi:Folate synthesis bifunctional protein [Spatholobus suberectus]|nr:Folate synthesis bifunctional protein [Spatholobus suberectus]
MAASTASSLSRKVMKHSFIGFVTFFEKKDATPTINNMDDTEFTTVSLLSITSSLNTSRVASRAGLLGQSPLNSLNNQSLLLGFKMPEISSELYSRIREAEMLGIPAWRIMIDPGIGFSKKIEDNLDILMGLPDIREEIAKRSLASSHAPIGPSRKRLLGEICSRPTAAERDPATIASVTAGVLGGANIVRVHNVKDNLDAVKFCDAILR